MILLDTALQQRVSEGRPIRAALIGCGFMGAGIVNQIVRYCPGIHLVVVVNRTPQKAVDAFKYAGVANVSTVNSASDVERLCENNGYGVTDDYHTVLKAESIDVVVESTGHVEYGARVICAAIEHAKDVVNMNAELDATVGPWLKVLADKAGVIVTGCDGDQPAVQINLCRFVESMGLKPMVCGNIKGLQDRYRTPETQAGFAKEWGQTATMVTSFADGTKISFEQAIVANATGMQVAVQGMIGHHHDGHVDDMTDWYDLDVLHEKGGIVDYVVGPKPGPGVFVFAEATDDSLQKHYLNYGKLGTGPLYSFYVPYHLTILEVPFSIARVALFRDEIIVPKGELVVDVIAVAKTDLNVGDKIDSLGGFKSYGVCENAAEVIGKDYLPMGIAEGATLKRAVKKDQPLTYADVELASEGLAIELRANQDRHFTGKSRISLQ